MKVRLSNMDDLKTIACDPLTATRALITALPQGEIYCVIDALEAEVPIDEGAFKDRHSLTWEMVSEMHQAGMTVIAISPRPTSFPTIRIPQNEFQSYVNMCAGWNLLTRERR